MTAYAGVRAAVLGATGFIGSWVARKLNDAGAETALVVRNRSRAAHLPGQMFELDLAEPGGIVEVLSTFRPAIVFNLAGYGIDPAERDQILAERLNAELPREVCNAVPDWNDVRWTGQQLIHVGSALEYGAVGGDLNEDGPAQPTTLYGETKLRGTRHMSECCVRLGLRGLTARLFTVYGPGEHSPRLLPSLMRTAQTGQILELTAGAQLRDFTYVEDVAEGLLRLGAIQAQPGLVVNLATGKLCSVRAFTETAARLLGIRPIQLRFGALPTRAEEMGHDPVTIRRLLDLTGFVPPTSLEDGIQKSIAPKTG